MPRIGRRESAGACLPIVQAAGLRLCESGRNFVSAGVVMLADGRGRPFQRKTNVMLANGQAISNRQRYKVRSFLLQRRLNGRQAAICIVLTLAAAWTAAVAATLPQPAGLQTEVDFWRLVFAEVTSDEVLVHDNRHLDVVYEKVWLPAAAGARERRQRSAELQRKYRSILQALAGGRRNGLTAEQRRVLNLWPDDVSNDELRQAAGRLRLQRGLADGFYQGLVRSGRWRGYIRDSLAREGVPESLAALPHVESSFNPAARSHVGAAGLWQFTRPTGRRFMQIDHVVDERLDPYRSSEAAARLLSYNYSILDDWPLAITAYNHGVAGMRRAVRRLGTKDIEAIVRNYSGRSFGFASRNFYVAFLAARDVELNAEDYFGPLKIVAPQRQHVVVMPDYVPVAALERTLGISRDVLRENNPALKPPVWKGTKYVPRGYALRLPADGNLRAPDRVLAGLPGNLRFAEQTPDLWHKVERGDSLSVIAARYRTSVSDLVALNGLANRHRIRAGQRLRLPYDGPQPSGPVAVDADGRYTVRRGDTLSEIARRAGVSESRLLAVNTITDRDRIYPGQQLIVADSALAEGGEPATSGDDAPGLLADPADYTVGPDGSIEVQAAETLGHFAEWLGVSTGKLRELNGYDLRQPVVIGHRLRLDFSRTDIDSFTAQRTAYHRELQESFFSHYRITQTMAHRMKRGESVWVLARRRYKVPVWLLRQYNPDLDLNRVRSGMKIVFPRVAPLSAGDDNPEQVADAV